MSKAKANLKIAPAQKKEACHCECCHDFGGEMVWHISQAHGLLSVVKAWTEVENPPELKGAELDGIFRVMEIVHKDLKKAMDEYFKIH